MPGAGRAQREGHGEGRGGADRLRFGFHVRRGRHGGVADVPAAAVGVPDGRGVHAHRLAGDLGGESTGVLAPEGEALPYPSPGVEVDHGGDVAQEEQGLVPPAAEPGVHVGGREPLVGERNAEDRPVVTGDAGRERTGRGQADAGLRHPQAVVAAVHLDRRREGEQGHQADAEPAGRLRVVGLAGHPGHRERDDVREPDRPAVVGDEQRRVADQDADFGGAEVLRVLHHLRQALEAVGGHPLGTAPGAGHRVLHDAGVGGEPGEPLNGRAGRLRTPRFGHRLARADLLAEQPLRPLAGPRLLRRPPHRHAPPPPELSAFISHDRLPSARIGHLRVNSAVGGQGCGRSGRARPPGPAARDEEYPCPSSRAQ